MKGIRRSFKCEDKMFQFQHTIETYRPQVDSYLEAIVSYCEDKGIDESEIVHLISPSLKQKIYKESKTAGLIVDNTREIELE